MNQVTAVLLWYFLVSLVGWITLPAAYRLLKFLPDRGYTLSRPLGLLVWGYLFWLLTSFGVLRNDSGGVLFALLLLAGISLLLIRREAAAFRDWLRSQSRLIFGAEGLFLAAYLAWVVVRAANPEILYTEKPMELAFINAVLRSPEFPPFDPWLSGYAISYYYFGYVIVAMLIHLSGVISSIGFNLGVAMWFGLTALACYGIVYNLLVGVFARKDSLTAKRKAAGWALLAPLLVLLIGNLSGLLDVLHARGIFWQRNEQGVLESSFWTWLGIKEFDQPPPEPLGWMPTRTFWLWWRGSRVIQDYNLLNQQEEVIDEFPFFSYLLADLHPHVLGMPFVLLAAGLSLQLYFSLRKQPPQDPDLKSWLKQPRTWAAALIFGGLSFLNTWDFPIYLALFGGVYVLGRYLWLGWSRQRIADFLFVCLLVGFLGVLLYLPFYIGFASQAGGILPSLIFHTRGVQFWVMFAPLLLPLFAWFVLQRKTLVRNGSLRAGLIAGASIVAGGWILMLLAAIGIGLAQAAGQGMMVSTNPNLAQMGQTLNNLANLYFFKQGGQGAELFETALLRRIASPGSWLTLLAVISAAWALLAALRRQPCAETARDDAPDLPQSDQDQDNRGFILLLILLGAGLTLAPEFFYLQDGFGTRMNTIFKFYFQAWILWGVAAAYASAVLLTQARGAGGAMLRVGWLGLMFAALLYPVVMLPAKTGLAAGQPLHLTLDGKAYLQRSSPDEWQAFQFLASAPLGVVVEAVGPQYNPDFARVATHSGQMGLLGWEGHILQWRGGGEEMGSRRQDIETLFQSADWERSREIIQQYGIRYIYMGPIERNTYRVNENKFSANLGLLFANQSVRIYATPSYLVKTSP